MRISPWSRTVYHQSRHVYLQSRCMNQLINHCMTDVTQPCHHHSYYAVRLHFDAGIDVCIVYTQFDDLNAAHPIPIKPQNSLVPLVSMVVEVSIRSVSFSHTNTHICYVATLVRYSVCVPRIHTTNFCKEGAHFPLLMQKKRIKLIGLKVALFTKSSSRRLLLGSSSGINMQLAAKIASFIVVYEPSVLHTHYAVNVTRTFYGLL